MKKIPVPPSAEVREVFLKIRMGMGQDEATAQAASEEALHPRTRRPVRRLRSTGEIHRNQESHRARTSGFRY
ncbi:MAG: hypothetical protein AAB365_03795 [Patescibacteria group bacterium]